MGPIFNFIRYNRYIRQIIKGENLLKKLKYLFGGREFKQDWIGRIWTVINPNVDNINDNNNVIIYDDGRPMIEKWIMDNLNIMSKFITSNNLFDLMTYRIRKIDEDDNYLVVFQNLYYESAIKTLKWILGILVGLGIIGITTLILI